MQLSARELEQHRQEQNLFKLIDLFKATVPVVEDEETNLFWQFIECLERKEINEQNIHSHASIDSTFLALRLMELSARHPQHKNIASWLPLLPLFVTEAYTKWKFAQDPQAQKNITQHDATKPYEIKGRTIFVQGHFDEIFMAQFNSLCESVGLDQPKLQQQSTGLSITVQLEAQVETCSLLLDSLLEDRIQDAKLDAQDIEMTLQDFVLM